MLLRCLLALAVVVSQLAACAGQPRNNPAIGEMERRHEEQMIRMGGSGGGGGSGM